MQINEINALVFDVFGTVVDWRMSIARAGKALARRKDITHVDWLEFADEWRAGYGPSMNRVRQGELPWTRRLHSFDYLLKGAGPLILIVPAMPCSSWPSLWQYSFRFLPFVMG